MPELYIYACMSRSCGYVEHTQFAPQASKKCPKCGGQMKRSKA